MTEVARESNGAPTDDMTTSKDAKHGKDAAAANAHKSSSPSKEKRHSAQESEAPSKSAKKRRKVNHGMPLMLCTQASSTALLT
jgi:hypothetical protein